MISGTTSNSDFQKDAGVDANSSSTTTPLRMGDAVYGALYVTAASGAHATHIIELQLSPDEDNPVNWFSTGHSVTGVGHIHDDLCVGQWIRAKVATVEGAASTVDIMVLIR